jgi:hypothetical protein
VAQHGALIAVLIIDRPMCRDCIAVKSRLSTVETECYLESIGRGLDVRVAEDRCRACGEHTVVFSLDRREF